MDSYRTLPAMNFFLEIFSLHYKSRSSISRWHHFKIIAIFTLFGSLTLFNLNIHYFDGKFRKVNLSVIFTDATTSILGYVLYLVDLWYVHKLSNEMCLYHNTYNQMDKDMNMKYYKKMKQKVIILIVSLLAMWFIASVGEYTAWTLTVGWLSPTTYSPKYFMTLIRFLTVMDLNAQTLQVKYRLRTITDELEELASLSDNSSTCIKISNKSGVNKTVRSKIQVAPLDLLVPKVTKLGSYYLLLIDQITFINKFFGVRILLHCMYTLIEMISFAHILGKVISGSMRLFTTVLPLAMATNFLRFFNYAAVLSSLVYHCESCYQQCSNIIDAADRLIVSKKINDDVKSSVRLLRKLVATRPLRFHAAGFFTLDSTLLLSAASVVITYTVLLVQSTQ